MVRILSLVALASAAVVAAVAAPAAATPTAASLPAVAPTAFNAVTFAVASFRQTVAARPPAPKGMGALVLRALKPMWAAFQAGAFDAKMAAFKAGKMDAAIPLQADVMKKLDKVVQKVDEVVQKVRMFVAKVFQAMADFKAGKFDAFIADAKKSAPSRSSWRVCARRCIPCLRPTRSERAWVGSGSLRGQADVSEDVASGWLWPSTRLGVRAYSGGVSTGSGLSTS